MREMLDPWRYVVLAYAIAIGATLAAVVWSGLAMRRAEGRRAEARRAEGRRDQRKT